MPITISKHVTIDATLRSWEGQSLYVEDMTKHHDWDILDNITFKAVRGDESSFTPLMRAQWVLFHDREIGVLAHRRDIHAMYAFSRAQKVSKRFKDLQGDTHVSAPTKAVLGRLRSQSRLVNVKYVINPGRQRIGALPNRGVAVGLEDTRDMPLLGSNEIPLFEPKVNTMYNDRPIVRPNQEQRRKVREYGKLIDQGMSIQDAHNTVYGKPPEHPTREEVATNREQVRTRRLLGQY